MIDIFASQAPGTTNPAQLAQGISMALYNTAFGLIVAIPALMFWRYFKGKVDGYLLELETTSEQFLRHLMVLRGSIKR
jgi:biopolymer transport protein ExbB